MVRSTKVPVKRIPTPNNSLLTNCPRNLETEKVANNSEDAEKKSSGQTSILSFMTKKKEKGSGQITTTEGKTIKGPKMTTTKPKTSKDSKMTTTMNTTEAQSILVSTIVSPPASISSSGYSSVEDNSLCVICNKSFKSRGCHYTKATISIAGMKRRFCEYFDISTAEVDSKIEDFLRKEKYPFCPSCFALVNDLYRRAEQVQIALKGFMKTKSDVIKATLEGRANSDAVSFSSRPYFDLVMKIINQKDRIITPIDADQGANCDEDKSAMNLRENFGKDVYLKGLYESTESEEISKSVSKETKKASEPQAPRNDMTKADSGRMKNCKSQTRRAIPISELSPILTLQQPKTQISKSSAKHLHFSPLSNKGKKLDSSSNSTSYNHLDSSSSDEESESGLNLNKKKPSKVIKKKNNVKVSKHINKPQESFSEDEHYAMADDAVIEKSEAEYTASVHRKSPTFFIVQQVQQNENNDMFNENQKEPKLNSPTDDILQQNYVIKRKYPSSSDSDSSDNDPDDKISNGQATSQNIIAQEPPKTKFQQTTYSNKRKIISSDSSSSDSEDEETHCGQVPFAGRKIPADDSLIPKAKVHKEKQEISESEDSDSPSQYKDKKLTDINSHLGRSKRNSSLSNSALENPKLSWVSSVKPSETQQFDSEGSMSKKVNRTHDTVKKYQDLAPISELSPILPLQESKDKITSAKRRLNFGPLTEGKKFKSICIPTSSSPSYIQDSSSNDEESESGLNLNKKKPSKVIKKKKNVEISKHISKSQESFSEDEHYAMADDAVIEKSEAEYTASVHRKSPTFFENEMLNENQKKFKMKSLKSPTDDNLKQNWVVKRKCPSSSDSDSSDSDTHDENSQNQVTSQNKMVEEPPKTKFQQTYSKQRKISSADSSSSNSEEDLEDDETHSGSGKGPPIKTGRKLPTLANDFKSSLIPKPKISKEKQKSSDENSSEDSDDPSFYRDKKLTDFRSTLGLPKRNSSLLSNPTLENPKPLLSSAKPIESQQIDSERTMSKKVNRAHDAVKKYPDQAPITAKLKTKLSAVNKSKPSPNSQKKPKISSTTYTKEKSGLLNLDSLFNNFQKSSKPSK